MEIFLLDQAVPAAPGKNLMEVFSHLGRDSDAPERSERECNTLSSSQISTTSPAAHAVRLTCGAAVFPAEGTMQSQPCHRGEGWLLQHCSPANPTRAEKPFIQLHMSRKTTSHERALSSGAGSRAAWAARAFGRWPVPQGPSRAYLIA